MRCIYWRPFKNLFNVVIRLTHNFFSLFVAYELYSSPIANGILRQIQKCEHFLHSSCCEVRRVGALLFVLWQLFGLKSQMLRC